MVKIYNIHSNTIRKEDLPELSKKIQDNEDIILLNEDLRYEIIDLDKMTVLKSRVLLKKIYSIIVYISKIRLKRIRNE